jgi:D-glycero-alpha-D-manno-heptose-7-phosphate kinase
MAIKTEISSRAPTRIDLAGGTIDLWPLYLFLERPTTINLGIDLFAEAELIESDARKAGQGAVTLRSDDQNIEQEIGWEALSQAKVPPQLELHLKLLRHFALFRKPGTDLTLKTRAKSPAGAGLGGSSTLSIAMIGALASWAKGQPVNPEEEGEKWIDIVRDVETTVIQVPAGVQDYYGAMFGGLQSLQWGPGRHHREWLPNELLPELESRLLLFYSGQSRNSGINNWALFKGFIDNQDDIRARFGKINQATRKLETCLMERRWTDAADAIASEWEVRRTLAAGISTPDMDRAFEIAKKIAPGRAGKICGAGGGGCFFIYLPNPKDKAAVEKALVDEGMRALPFHAVPRGLEVHIRRGA